MAAIFRSFVDGSAGADLRPRRVMSFIHIQKIDLRRRLLREIGRDFSDARELQGGRRRRAKSQQNVAAGRHCVFLRCAFRLSTI